MTGSFSSPEDNFCTVFGIPFQRDCDLWEISLSKNFSRRFVSGALEQERTIVFLFLADRSRDGNCKYLLLNTVTAFSRFLFSADILPSLSLTPYSCLISFVSGLTISCSDLLVSLSLYHGLQLLITRLRSILMDFLFVHGKYCVELIIGSVSCTNSPDSCHWELLFLIAKTRFPLGIKILNIVAMF